MNVPLDVWCGIVGFLTDPKDIHTVNEACRYFHRVCTRLLESTLPMVINGKTILYKSINLFSLQKAIQNGFQDWNVALVQSAYGGNIHLVNFFVQRGAIRFRRALYKASKRNYHHVVEYIVNHNFCGDLKWGLEGASRGGHLELIQYFIDRGIDDIQTIAYNASRGGHIDILRRFNINYSRGDPVIHAALLGGHIDTIEYLVQQGAIFYCNDMEQVTKKGRAYLIKYFDTLPDVHKWNFALKGAATRGDMDLIQLCIQNGAANWDYGMNGAALGGHFHFVEYFIQMGACYWENALLASIEGGHKNLVKYFSSKVHPTVWSYALQYAARGGHKDLIDYCIQKCQTILDSDITSAVDVGYEDIAQYLEEKQGSIQ